MGYDARNNRPWGNGGQGRKQGILLKQNLR